MRKMRLNIRCNTKASVLLRDFFRAILCHVTMSVRYKKNKGSREACMATSEEEWMKLCKGLREMK